MAEIIIYLISVAISLCLMYLIIRVGVRDGINASKLVDKDKS